MIEITYDQAGQIHQFHDTTLDNPTGISTRTEMTGMTTRAIDMDYRTMLAIAKDAERWRVVETNGNIDFKLVE